MRVGHNNRHTHDTQDSPSCDTCCSPFSLHTNRLLYAEDQRDIVKSLCRSRKGQSGRHDTLRAAGGKTTRAKNTKGKDLLIYRVDNKFVFQNVHPDTAATLHEGRVVAVREEINFHFLWSP